MKTNVVFLPHPMVAEEKQSDSSKKPCLKCVSVTFFIAVVVISTAILTPHNMLEIRFGRNERFLHSGDMMSLSHATPMDLSPTWCSGYRVEPNQRSDMYLVSPRPSVNPDLRANLNFTTTLEASDEDGIVTRVHYLLPGSIITLSACRNVTSHENPLESDDSELAVIFGRKRFQVWAENEYSNDFVRANVPINASALCHHDSRHLPTISFILEQPTECYFVLRGNRSVDYDFIMSGYVNRTYYDVSKNVMADCNDTQSWCVFHLPWRSDIDVIVSVLENSTEPNMPLSVFTKCQPRLVIWLVSFVAAPAILVIFLAVVCFCMTVIRQRRLYAESRQRMNKTISRSPSTYGTTIISKEKVPQTISELSFKGKNSESTLIKKGKHSNKTVLNKERSV